MVRMLKHRGMQRAYRAVEGRCHTRQTGAQKVVGDAVGGLPLRDALQRSRCQRHTLRS